MGDYAPAGKTKEHIREGKTSHIALGDGKETPRTFSTKERKVFGQGRVARLSSLAPLAPLIHFRTDSGRRKYS